MRYILTMASLISLAVSVPGQSNLWTIHDCKAKPGSCVDKGNIKEAYGQTLIESDGRVLSPEVKMVSENERIVKIVVVIRETMPHNFKFQPKKYEYEVISGATITKSSFAVMVRSRNCENSGEGNCGDWETREGKAPMSVLDKFKTRFHALTEKDLTFSPFF